MRRRGSVQQNYLLMERAVLKEADRKMTPLKTNNQHQEKEVLLHARMRALI